MSFVNIGFGNIINTDKVISMISPDSAPAKRLLQNQRECGKVIDATQGRRTRAIIVTDSGYLVLSALQPDTVAARAKGNTTVVNESTDIGEENE